MNDKFYNNLKDDLKPYYSKELINNIIDIMNELEGGDK